MKIIAALFIIALMLMLFAWGPLLYATIAALVLVVICKVVTVFCSAAFDIHTHNGSYHEHHTGKRRDHRA